MFGNGFFGRSQASTVVCNRFFGSGQACLQSIGSSVQTTDAVINFDKFVVRLFFGVHLSFSVHVGTVCFFTDSSLVRGYLVGYCIQCGFVCFFTDSSLVRGYLVGYCIQCGLICLFGDSSFVFLDSRFVGFDIGTDFIDNFGSFYQCFAVFIDGFGQVFKALVVFSHDFFQTQTFKVVGFNIGCSCFFFGNLAIFINVVDGVFFFETVDILGIFVGSK